MSDKHSAASRARWANVPAEEKSKIMSQRGKQFWASLTPAQKKQKLLSLKRAKQK